MNLDKRALNLLAFPPTVQLPPVASFTLPERVIQFGTGVLLRGLIDYFIDKANRQGIFNGRVVVVKSTDRGGSDEFNEQDGLFTHAIRGIRKGEKVDEAVINSSISTSLINMTTDPVLILLIINLLLLFVGIFMNMTPAVLIFTPIFLPVVTQLG